MTGDSGSSRRVLDPHDPGNTPAELDAFQRELVLSACAAGSEIVEATPFRRGYRRYPLRVRVRTPDGGEELLALKADPGPGKVQKEARVGSPRSATSTPRPVILDVMTHADAVERNLEQRSEQMDRINTALSIQERIEVGKRYAKAISDEYPDIESVILFGSTIRGDCLPVSDLDMHYIVSRDAPAIQIRKGVREGVFMDVNRQYREDLTADAVLSDGYLFGLVNDCVVVFDRTGYVTQVKQEVSRRGDLECAETRLKELATPVVNNARNFRLAIDAADHAELCRTSGFMMWCLSDYLLAKHRRPAGGFRTLARLKMVNTDAYLDILKLQDSIYRSADELRSFSELSYRIWNAEKVDWMFEHGFKDDAFHDLWICLGLKAKDLRNGVAGCLAPEIRSRSREWLERLDWDIDRQRGKADEMDVLIERYVE
jgi:hypothetical protein